MTFLVYIRISHMQTAKSLLGHDIVIKWNIMFMCRPPIILLLFKKKVLSTLVFYRASLVHLKQHLLHSSITWKYKYRCSTQLDSPVQSPRITHTARLEKWPTRLQRSHWRYILLHIQSLQTQSLRTYYKVESLHSELLELLKTRGERQKSDIRSKGNSAFLILVCNNHHLKDTLLVMTKLSQSWCMVVHHM